ncbi:MAG: quinone-dependent dihydroorotate dehydrogenase [Pseudomonadota bacterium]
MLSRALDFARQGLLKLDPETAHSASLGALERGLHPRVASDKFPSLRTQVAGLEVPNPLGIAAGYDKDARVPDALLAMGMGFVEVGTLTPRAQAGNPMPRVFRIAEEKAVINRLGFNNGGHDLARARLVRRGRRPGVLGVNIGANKTASDRVADYVAGVRTFAPFANYFMVNVSSPNTPGLRDLQAPRELKELLARVGEARAEVARDTPLFVKLAPDIAGEDVPAIIEVIVAAGVDGICVSNTTVARPGVEHLAMSGEAGGLSGAPLFDSSTRMLAEVWLMTEGKVPLIGVGGITDGASAVAKIEAGASLVQLYTGLIYGGAGLIADILDEMDRAVRAAGKTTIADLVGCKAGAWANR